MKRSSVSLLFPLTLSLLLGATSFWLNRATNLTIETVKLDLNKPQYVLHNIHLQRFDEQGRLKNNLSAEKAWQMPNNPQIFFSKPKLSVSENDKPLYNLSAVSAVYNPSNKQADLHDDVQAVKYDEQGKILAQTYAPHLHIDEIDGTADTLSRLFEQNTNGKNRIKTVIYDTQQIKK